MKKGIVSLFFILLSQPIFAKTYYVSDELFIYARSGPTDEYRIQKTLKAGTKLDILEHNSRTGYSRIKADNGYVGWIKKQYISDKPIARIQLEETEKELERTKQENEKLQRMLQDIKNTYRDMEGNQSSLHLNISTLEQEVQQLKGEKELAEKRKTKDQMLMGGILVFAGVLLALVIPRLKPRRRERW